MYQVIPAEAIDVMEQTATLVRDDPNRSEDDHNKANEILAQIPELRAKLSAGYGAAYGYENAATEARKGSASFRIGLLQDSFLESRLPGQPPAPGDTRPQMESSEPGYWDPQFGYVYTADQVRGYYSVAATNINGAAYGPRPGFPGFASPDFGLTAANGFAADGVDCKEEFWEWTLAVSAVGGSVLTVASGVYMITETGGAAIPVGWGLVRKGTLGIVAGAITLGFKHSNLQDCIMRWNQARYQQ